MPRTADPNKEDLKNIKVKASTHARLSIIATALDKTIAELIEDLLDEKYTEMNREAGRALNKIRSLKAEADEDKA